MTGAPADIFLRVSLVPEGELEVPCLIQFVWKRIESKREKEKEYDEKDTKKNLTKNRLKKEII